MAKYKRNKSSRARPGFKSRSDRERDQIESLQRRIDEETPERGSAPPLHQKVSFRALPISDETLRGLEDGHKTKKFVTMTAIQNACIPHALAGRDVLGAARTGSGKTLAFLVPLLEKLYRSRISPGEGPAGIVLSPTRELAVQIFEVLRIVGSYHNLSAGLLVGGKKEFRLEQTNVGRTNVLIATPGRLLQHLEQTPNFDTDGVSMLVLDEADRILDMGFRDQMVRILDYLPSGVRAGGERQTLLFSATQTKRVADLAALSLDRPEYIGVHDREKTSTPESLVQSVVTVPLQHKLDAVFSFVKSHLRTKTIVFFASCSQVRHVWEVFCALQPGVPVMCLHGKIKQERRTKIYFDFLQRPHAVLFATDVAARGLDFPNVDWVVQADAPEDKDMYIHRVGRTARYNAGGRSLLCLLPSEFPAMSKLLENAKIPIKKLSINPTKTVLVSQRAAAIVASNPKLNSLAKKAFKSYVRSVSLMPNKDVFKVSELPLDDYATSLGLASTPNLQFLKKAKDREQLRGAKNVNHKLDRLKQQIKAERFANKLAKMGASAEGDRTEGQKKEKRKLDEAEGSNDDEGDDNGGLLLVKRKHHWGIDDSAKPSTTVEENLPDVHLHEAAQSRHPKKIRIDVSNTEGKNKRIVFDDNGEERDADALLPLDAEYAAADLRKNRDGLLDANEEYMRKVRERLSSTRNIDRAEEKERVREKHRKKRISERRELDSDAEEGREGAALVTLGGTSDDGEYEDRDGSSAEDEREKDDDSDDESESDTDTDIQAKEDLALAILRQKR